MSFYLYKKNVTNDLTYQNVYICGEVCGNCFIPNGAVHACRETFQASYLRGQSKNKKLFFGLTVNPAININNFNLFLRQMEQKIGIEKTIEAHPVSEENKMVVIEINEFWLSSKIRQEFITIFLRCYSTWITNLQHSYKDAFKKACEDRTEFFDEETFNLILYSQSYFDKTKNAVQQFLSGRVYMKKPYKADMGWYNRFTRNDDEGNPEIVLTRVLKDSTVIE